MSGITLCMITFNEIDNLKKNLRFNLDIADSIVCVDSGSTDGTIEYLEDLGVTVYTNKFEGFGNQWNYLLDNHDFSTQWALKLDPDERITVGLSKALDVAISSESVDVFKIKRRLYFLGGKIGIYDWPTRLWRVGKARFSDVRVNEHLLPLNEEGRIGKVFGVIEHHDSPSLFDWYVKQNLYSTLEANSRFNNESLSVKPVLFGSSLQRRMFLKNLFYNLPMRYTLIFMYYYVFRLNILYGKRGYYWSVLRREVFRMREIKTYELNVANSTKSK